ncbi:universal stress protein [Ideonella sp. B7]|uniref:universal stress protein n=1 Tax=Ideonella benzenivorans TaxID=2831643 RepID=UPI001CECA350|nr:universal stress protein [Ideonella benzenivorans]MCA6216383.1 universal stress protein [Ideonella benzenivorans]
MYKKILVPVDGSPTAECGLNEAIKLAAGSSTALHLLYVVDQYPMLVDFAAAASYEEVQEDLRRYGKEVLAKALETAKAAGVSADSVEREVIGGRVADVVVEEAGKAGCDLIVMGTHGRRGLSRLTLGSDAELVVRHAPVPVLLVRHAEAPR